MPDPRVTESLRQHHGRTGATDPGRGGDVAERSVHGDVSPYAALWETHSGVVILLGERAYKVKKPVNLGFLDFSTRELRLRACRREVDLNRRLAPDVYLGVADVIGPDGGVQDHMVEMKRMPDHLRLSTLVRSGADVENAVRTIARNVATFHARCTRSDEITARGSRDALRWPGADTVDTRETPDACVRLAAGLLRPARGTHPRVRSRMAPD